MLESLYGTKQRSSLYKFRGEPNIEIIGTTVGDVLVGMAENPAAAAAVNHGEGLRLPETSSICVTESAAHNFEVTNYALLEGLGVGKYITSSTFRGGGYDWNIMFYPDGSTKDFTGNASAFLYYLSKGKDGVRTKFTLTLLDGQAMHRKSTRIT